MLRNFPRTVTRVKLLDGDKVTSEEDDGNDHTHPTHPHITLMGIGTFGRTNVTSFDLDIWEKEEGGEGEGEGGTEGGEGRREERGGREGRKERRQERRREGGKEGEWWKGRGKNTPTTARLHTAHSCTRLTR